MVQLSSMLNNLIKLETEGRPSASGAEQCLIVSISFLESSEGSWGSCKVLSIITKSEYQLYNYLVRYWVTIVKNSISQVIGHCPLVSVQTTVTILVRQRPDLVHAGDWQILPQEVLHLLL